MGVDVATDVDSAKEFLISTLPKRWSYYPPLVLLPPTAFNSRRWKAYLASLSDDQRTEFYTAFTSAIHPNATHLAVNAPIPPITTAALNALTSSLSTATITHTPPTTPQNRSSNRSINTLRSPTNLTPLLGLFGPPPPSLPTPSTLPLTLFTTATQLSIHQIWSPLHTMFSRGNISEKSRILTPTFPGARAIPNSLTLDLYAGIGYFTFCYLRAGAGVVLCWELNPWSVEGLVRGMNRNGFGGIVVVGEGEETPAVELGGEGGPGVLVFNEDNQHASRRLLELRGKGKGKGLPVKHVNLGLLPTSQGGYRVAVEAILIGDGDAGEKGGETVGWAHVHENVAAGEEEEKGLEVKREFERLVREVGGENGGVELDGEKGGFRVKSYAPGVVHVVYDVKIWR
ncbi:S-adenosyl-L-methionine-dependent methyltransferase [Tirmania nivea]|nr:S-adenosyl-L-methionine-dependent methyltransferase [Tirmania nivea]